MKNKKMHPQSKSQVTKYIVWFGIWSKNNSIIDLTCFLQRFYLHKYNYIIAMCLSIYYLVIKCNRGMQRI